MVKCPKPTTRQLFQDLPIYFPHYKNGCLEMFLQAGWIITRRPKGRCVFIKVLCPLLRNLKIVLIMSLNIYSLKLLEARKYQNYLWSCWKNHLKRKVLLGRQEMSVLKLQGQISDAELKTKVVPLKVI